MALFPKIKLKALPTFPSVINGGVGIDVAKQNGALTVDLDYTDFGVLSSIPVSPTSYILTYDTQTTAYVMVPSHLLGGGVSGIADAPIDGTQYARQSGAWTPTLPLTGGSLTGTLKVSSASFTPTTVDAASLITQGNYGGGLTFQDGSGRSCIFTNAFGGSLEFATGSSAPPVVRMVLSSTTVSTSPTTGAMTVAGDVGINGALNIAGIATAMTPTPSTDNSTKLATTAFVQALVGGAGGSGGSIQPPNIEAFGGKGDNATDNLAPAIAALNSNPAFPCIFFPPGKYYFSNALTYSPNGPISLIGCGSDTTELTWPNAGGIALTGNGSTGFHVRDLSITTGQNGASVGLQLRGRFGVAANDVTRVVFRGADGYQATNYWSQDINLQGAWNTNVLQCQFIGGGAAFQGIGIAIGNTTGTTCVFNITDCLFTFHNIGFQYDEDFQGVTIKGSNFTNNNIGVYVTGGNTGQDELFIANCQFGPAEPSGVAILISSHLADFSLVGNLIFANPSTTTVDISNIFNASITGNFFRGQGAAPTNANGIFIHSNDSLSSGTISGNTFFNLNAGVALAAGTSGWNVQANSYSAVSTHVFNPAGAANSVGVATQ